jgi:HAE1 family hydrophobic/amphiphilic exporter-1
MILSDVSIKRPVFATIVNLVLVVFGIFSLPELAVDMLPNVDFPFATVTVVYPGADPETIEQKVLDPLEEAVNGISGLDQLASNAYPSLGQIILRFKLEKNSDQAAQEVRDKVFAAVGSLPPDVETPVIAKFEIGAAPVMDIAVDSKGMGYQQLSALVKDTIKPALERVPGVASVNTAGIREREIHVLLNRDQLNAFGLGPSDVVNALASQNVDLPAGQVKNKKNFWNIRLKGKAHDAAAIAAIPIITPTGQSLRISEVATVEDTLEEEESAAYSGGKPTILLSVVKQSGTNTPQVAEAVHHELAKIKKYLPETADLAVVNDDSAYIVGAIDSVKVDLIVGAFLAVLIVFAFLRDKWITLISAIALPTSVIATFAFLRFMDFTLNMMTTLGLSLAIGILIDDAIIVIENIHRHLSMGKTGFQAAKDATSEIGLAVFATTLAICAVFVPVAFMEGMIGRFFYQFGLTITFAVLVSLFCAFTISPMMSSRLLTPGEEEPKNKWLKKFWEASEHFLTSVDQFYRKTLMQALHHRTATLGIGVGIFVLSIIMVAFVPVTFFAKEDRSKIDVVYLLPEGTSLDATRIKALELSNTITRFPGVQRVITSIGAGQDKKPNRAQLRVSLVDPDQRSFSQEEMMVRLRKELGPAYAPTPDTELKVYEAGGMGGGRSEPIQFIFKSDNWPKLVEFTDKVAEYVKQNVAGTVDVATTKPKNTEEYTVSIDKVRAADLMLSVGQIGMALRTLLEGEKVGEMDENGRSIDIRVRVADRDRTDPSDLNGITIRNPQGQNVMLSSVASITKGDAPSVIERFDGARQITLLANFDGKDLNKASGQIIKYVDQNLPPEITMTASGMTEVMQESIVSMLKALAIAVLLVYMVLCAQYESYLAPLVIMAALPLSLAGAFGSLLITGQVMSVFTMIGIILLMGIVTKNGILLIDFTIQRMKEGLSVNEALLEAGPIRLRPILMTTFAAGGGMVPVAIGHGLGGEARSPMGVAVIGGLLMSTLLTLLVVPCLFSLVEEYRMKRIQRKKARKLRSAPHSAHAR